MAKYRFKAYTRGGRLESGELEAESERTALEALTSRGLFASEIGRASAGASAAPWWRRELSSSRSVDLAGQALLAREMATLLRAGVTVDEALGIMELQPRLGARIRKLLTLVQADVRAGATLSAALAAREGAVPEAFWMLVRAGETGGTLKEVLGELADSLNEVARMRKQLITAMVYPLVLLIASGITVALILTVMVPAIIPLFRDAGVEPPGLISALAAGERMLSHHWPVVLVATVAGVLAWRIAWRSERTALAIDSFMLRLPLLKGMIQNVETARFARTLSMLLGNGVPVLDALRVSGNALRNRAYKAVVLHAEEEVNRGGTLIASLSQTALLPPLAVRLIALGEQTGQLPTMLGRVAELYEQDSRQRMERLLAVSTPAVTIAIGGLVGFIMLSVVSAMMSLNDVVLR